jgi:hypothetical protein
MKNRFVQMVKAFFRLKIDNNSLEKKTLLHDVMCSYVNPYNYCYHHKYKT